MLIKIGKDTTPPTTPPITVLIMPLIPPTPQMLLRTIPQSISLKLLEQNFTKTIILLISGSMPKKMFQKTITKHINGPSSGRILMKMPMTIQPTPLMPQKIITKPPGSTM